MGEDSFRGVTVFLSFLEDFFCNSFKKKLETCSGLNEELTAKCSDLSEKNASLLTVNETLKSAVESWKREADSYKTQLEILQKTAIILPDISEYVTDPHPYDVYDILDTSKFQFVIAVDLLYNAFTYEQWINILNLIYPIIKDRWVNEVWDCDNFAEFTHALMMKAFMESGLSKQGMIAITYSRKHAYNVFVTDDEKWFIYEPQTNMVVGELFDESVDDLYKTRLILFTN